jgi:conjugal transfer pilus assembly protein TraF
MTAQSPAYYQRKAEGWFWKVPSELPSEGHAPKPEDPPAPQDVAESPKVDPPLSSAWFRKQLPLVRDQALDDPTPENVHRYFVMQKAMIDKAERFSLTARSVVLQDPLLDEPPGLPGTEAEAPRHLKSSQLHRIAQRSGLLFVFRSDCPYCHQMAPILHRFAEQYGFRLRAVSLDGPSLQGLSDTPITVDPSLSDRLHLSGTPALFLLVPPQGIHRLLEGAATEADLAERLLALGLELGLLGPSPPQEVPQRLQPSSSNPSEPALVKRP